MAQCTNGRRPLGRTGAAAARRGLVNTGNETDLRFVDVMAEVLADHRVKAGAGYIEGLKDGPGLVALAERALEAGKPMIITKVGRTQAGARAVASHTGSLAGADAVFGGVVRQYGIVRARSDEQLLDFTEVFTRCAPPEGRGIGIMTRSGGAGALMADRAEELGLEVVQLSAETTVALKKVVPAFGSTHNPVDITAQGLVDPGMRNAVTDKVYKHAVSTILPMSDTASPSEAVVEGRAPRERRSFTAGRAQ